VAFPHLENVKFEWGDTTDYGIITTTHRKLRVSFSGMGGEVFLPGQQGEPTDHFVFIEDWSHLTPRVRALLREIRDPLYFLIQTFTLKVLEVFPENGWPIKRPTCFCNPNHTMYCRMNCHWVKQCWEAWHIDTDEEWRPPDMRYTAKNSPYGDPPL